MNESNSILNAEAVEKSPKLPYPSFEKKGKIAPPAKIC